MHHSVRLFLKKATRVWRLGKLKQRWCGCDFFLSGSVVAEMVGKRRRENNICRRTKKSTCFFLTWNAVLFCTLQRRYLFIGSQVIVNLATINLIIRSLTPARSCFQYRGTHPTRRAFQITVLPLSSASPGSHSSQSIALNSSQYISTFDVYPGHTPQNFGGVQFNATPCRPRASEEQTGSQLMSHLATILILILQAI